MYADITPETARPANIGLQDNVTVSFTYGNKTISIDGYYVYDNEKKIGEFKHDN